MIENTYDLRDTLRFRVRFHFHVRIVNGVSWGPPLAAPLLALLGCEVTLAGPHGRVDAVTTPKALNLFPRTLGRRFDMPASLVGADEVLFALWANPLASKGVVFKTGEVGLGRLHVAGVAQGAGVVRGYGIAQGAEDGERRWRELGIVVSGYIHDAQLGRVVGQTISKINEKDGFLR